MAVALSAVAGALAVSPVLATAVRMDQASPLREPVALLWSYLVTRFGNPVVAGYWFVYLVRVAGLLVALAYWAIAARGIQPRQWLSAILLAFVLPAAYEVFSLAQAIVYLGLGVLESGVEKPELWDAGVVGALAALLLACSAAWASPSVAPPDSPRPSAVL
jgi:hypothetical protein